MFIPYKLDLSIYRTPVVSICIGITCILVFLGQIRSSDRFEEALYEYCADNLDGALYRTVRALYGDRDSTDGCMQVIARLHFATAPHTLIERLAEDAPGLAHPNPVTSRIRIRETLSSHLSSAASVLPSELTSELRYQAGSFNVVRMFTSDLAHAGWGHLVGNLVFFAAFAPAVEVILGWPHFLLALIVVVVGEHVVFSLWHVAAATPPAVIGLSGVVAAMMGLLVFLWPTAPIRCLLLLVVIPIRFSLPALLLAAGYIGWDAYYLLSLEDTQTSFVSHVGGFTIGVLYGALLLREVRRDLPKLIKRG